MSTIDRHHNALLDVETISHELCTLADSFEAVGNGIVSDKLVTLAMRLNVVRVQAGEAFSERLEHEFKQAQANSANVLSATLAGMHIAQKQQAEPAEKRFFVVAKTYSEPNYVQGHECDHDTLGRWCAGIWSAWDEWAERAEVGDHHNHNVIVVVRIK